MRLNNLFGARPRETAEGDLFPAAAAIAAPARKASEGDLFAGVKEGPKALIGDGLPGVEVGFGPREVARIMELMDNGDGYSPMFPITPELAMRVGVVYRCVSVISGHLMQCPIRIRKRKIVKGRIAHEPYALELEGMLNRAPDERFTGPQALEYATACMLLYGDGFAIIERRGMGGEVVGFRMVHPDNVHPFYQRNGGRRVAYNVRDRESGEIRTYDQSDIIDFQGAFHGGLRAMSLVGRAAASSIRLHRHIEYSKHDFYSRGNQQRIMMRAKQHLNEDDLEKAVKSWLGSWSMGTRTRNLPIFVSNEWEVPDDIGIKPDDAQLLETHDASTTDIVRVFGVPGILAGVEDKTSSWGTGVERITNNFHRATLAPPIIRFGAELTRKLFPRNPEIEVVIDKTPLLRASFLDTANYYRIALGGGSQNGFLKQNEVREELGYPPEDGPEYDKVYHVGMASTKPGEMLDGLIEKVEREQNGTPESEGDPDVPPSQAAGPEDAS